MKNANLKNLMDQLSNENLNLVVDENVVAGTNSGSIFTISNGFMWGWSFSDMWDGGDHKTCNPYCN